MAKATFDRKKYIFTSKLNLKLTKELLKFCISFVWL